MTPFKEQLALNVRAGAPIVQIVSCETLRVRAYCAAVSKETGRNHYLWNSVKGLSIEGSGPEPSIEGDEITECLDWLRENEESSNSIILIEDLHHYLNDSNHKLISRLRDFANQAFSSSVKNTTVVLSQPVALLPPELEKEVQLLDMPLPQLEELETLAEQASQKFNIASVDFQVDDAFLKSALGLSTAEVQLAFAKVACDRKRLSRTEIPLVVKEKEQVIRKSGHLEYFHPEASIDDVGGLDNLKEWLRRRKNAFTPEAEKFGLEPPRGVLLLGLPGTGKSLAAKAVADSWQLPLLRLDMGKIYGGIVGQSEANIRSALKTAEALAPSILWVDEIEKGLSGADSSGATDGGTTARVLGSFLTWMQEKKSPVFVVATANNVQLLPPELLRKGRVDEIFFVDLPVLKDRCEILAIHLRRRRQDIFSESDMIKLAEKCHGFTGAEIEEAVREALFMAFDAGQPLATAHLFDAIGKTTPLSISMEDRIEGYRKWAHGRTVAASSEKPERRAGSKRASPDSDNNPFNRQD